MSSSAEERGRWAASIAGSPERGRRGAPTLRQFWCQPSWESGGGTDLLTDGHCVVDGSLYLHGRGARATWHPNGKGRPVYPGRPFRGYSAVANHVRLLGPTSSRHQPRRDSTFWGLLFAWARTDVLAWTRIWALVSAAVSAAKSASRMALSLAVTFSSATFRLFTLDSSTFFWNAPSRPRNVATWRMAAERIFWPWMVLPV